MRRQRLHLELGALIELVYASTLQDHFTDLAYHYRRGGNTRKAVEFLSRAGCAGDRSARRTRKRWSMRLSRWTF